MVDRVVSREIGSDIADHYIDPAIVDVILEFTASTLGHKVPAQKVNAGNRLNVQQIDREHGVRNRYPHTLHRILRPSSRGSTHVYHDVSFPEYAESLYHESTTLI